MPANDARDRPMTTDPQTHALRPPRTIDIFVPPNPSPWLIKALVPVNRVLCLGGVPGLRSTPSSAGCRASGAWRTFVRLIFRKRTRRGFVRHSAREMQPS